MKWEKVLIKNLHITPRYPFSTVFPSLSFSIASSIFYRPTIHPQSCLRFISLHRSHAGWCLRNSFQNPINQDNRSLDCHCHYYHSHHRSPYPPWQVNRARSWFRTKIHCVPPESEEKLSLLSLPSWLKCSNLAGPRSSLGLYDRLKVTNTRLVLYRDSPLLWSNLLIWGCPFLQLWWSDWLVLPHWPFRTVSSPWMLQIFIFSSQSVLGGWVDLRKTSSVWFLLRFQLFLRDQLCIKPCLLLKKQFFLSLVALD